MDFCSKCGSRMIRTKEGIKCRKCGNKIAAKSSAREIERKEIQLNGIHVFERQDDSARVARKCPRCGSDEAIHWFSGVSGEHAGIMRERTVEHFKCTVCSHSWAETA